MDPQADESAIEYICYSENTGGRNDRKCSRFIRRWVIIEGYRDLSGDGLSSKNIARTQEVGTTGSVSRCPEK